jgi:hypothetical protein
MTVLSRIVINDFTRLSNRWMGYAEKIPNMVCDIKQAGPLTIEINWRA